MTLASPVDAQHSVGRADEGMSLLLLKASRSLAGAHERFALVLGNLGPSLENPCNIMPTGMQFDEKMILALAIQMVCDFPCL